MVGKGTRFDRADSHPTIDSKTASFQPTPSTVQAPPSHRQAHPPPPHRARSLAPSSSILIDLGMPRALMELRVAAVALRWGTFGGGGWERWG